MSALDPLRDLLRVWRDELDALVPLRWRARRLPSRALILATSGERFEAARIDGGKLAVLGPIDLDRREVTQRLRKDALPVVLRLPADAVLQTEDLLPTAAEADLGPIIANRLDALSPWPAGACAFDQEVVARSATEGLTVRVTMAPRRLVDDLVAWLAERDVAVDHVDVADGPRWAPPRIDLMRSGAIRAGSLPWGRLAATVVGLALLTGGALAGLGVLERLGSNGLRAETASLERQAETMAPLRNRAAALRAQVEALRARGAAIPSALAVLDDLSRILPETAWLEEFRLAGDTVQIGGYAADAAPLLALLENDPSLTRAEFRAASTRTTVSLPSGETREVDRFSIAVVAERPKVTP